MNKIKASKIRKEICILKVQRNRLESLALRHRVMIKACLIERFLGTKERKRGTPAYYLSRKFAGKTRLIYIPWAMVKKIRKKADSWREYGVLMKGINALSQRIIYLFRQLARVQVDSDWEE